MDFPIVDLLDDDISESWLVKHFHPKGLKCSWCRTKVNRARAFRQTRRSQVTVYRCQQCQSIYTLYSGTVFEAKHLRPAQVVLLLRGICKGEPTAGLARELHLSRRTVHELRKQLQANALRQQPTTPLPDRCAETDADVSECGGKKAKNIAIHAIRHGGVPTSGAGMGRMPMIDHRLLGRSDGAADKCGCAW
jgi:hypothetical protein